MIFWNLCPWRVKMPECAYIAKVGFLLCTILQELVMEIRIVCLLIHTWSMGKSRVAGLLGDKLLEVILYPLISFDISKALWPFFVEVCSGPSYKEETDRKSKPCFLPQNKPYFMKLFWIKNFNFPATFAFFLLLW